MNAFLASLFFLAAGGARAAPAPSFEPWGALEVDRELFLELVEDSAEARERELQLLPDLARHLRVSIERGRSLHSRHLASLALPERVSEPAPTLDEVGFGVEVWYSIEPLLLRSGGRPGIRLGVGVRGLFSAADPEALEGCLLTFSARL